MKHNTQLGHHLPPLPQRAEDVIDIQKKSIPLKWRVYPYVKELMTDPEFQGLIGSTSKLDSPMGKTDADDYEAASMIEAAAKDKEDTELLAYKRNTIKNSMNLVLREMGYHREGRIQRATQKLEEEGNANAEQPI